METMLQEEETENKEFVVHKVPCNEMQSLLLVGHQFSYLWVNKCWLWRTESFGSKIWSAVTAWSADGVWWRWLVQMQQL
jgi:hypothetical protein